MSKARNMWKPSCMPCQRTLHRKLRAVMCWDGSCMLKSEMAASQVIKIVDKERR